MEIRKAVYKVGEYWAMCFVLDNDFVNTVTQVISYWWTLVFG